jgi:para-nitrobenzyl esterase
VVVAAMLAWAGPASAAPVAAGHRSGPVVATDGGLVRGTSNGAQEAFRGIPYAAPPVGALRWQPPRPAARWAGVRDASTFAPHCAQPAGSFGVASMSEDCLYLNVYKPAGPVGHRPVMVWIHGGALVTGESDDYDARRLAGLGEVVVTINYRLGALGFLAHPALAAAPGGPAGNYGLMDQQAALRWVRADVGRFGGDARDVTIFGESAGGLSVLSQVASAGARGLFTKAIVESGTYALTQASLATAETAGRSFAAAAGCADQSAGCLRSLPVSAVLAHENTGGFQPDVDGAVLTRSLRDSFDSGQFNRVPIVNGSNHDEWRLFVGANELRGSVVTAANYQAMIAQTARVTPAVAATVAARYPLTAFASPALALSAVGTDAIFACSALTLDESVSKFVPTFAYEFNDENAPQQFLAPVSFPYGAAHASELQYLFPAPPTGAPLSAAQQRLAATMQADWTNFARFGVPVAFGSGAWPRFDGATQRIESLRTPRTGVETGFAADHHCGFWAGLR